MIEARLHRALAIVVLLLGIGHSALGLYAARLTGEHLWFVGSGLAIICAGSANLVGSRDAGHSLMLLLAAQNLLLTAFFAAAWFVVPMPQVAVGGAAFLAMEIITLRWLLRPQV